MRLLFLILAACLAAFGYSAAHERIVSQLDARLIDLRVNQAIGQAHFPITIGGGTRRALAFSFADGGESLTLRLTIDADGPYELWQPGDRQIDISACGGAPRCMVQVDIGTNRREIFMLAPAPLTVRAVRVELLRAQRVAQLGGIPVVTALCLLALLAPAMWYAPPKVRDALVCMAAVGWMAAIDWRIMAAMLAMLALFLALLRWIEWRPNRGSGFLATVLGAIGVLLLVKSVEPLVAGFLADPAGMFLLPIGFSYFIIRIIDLASKVYARQMTVPGPLDYFAYMLFPPALAAGPIMTIGEYRQGGGAFTSLEDRTEGLMRIVCGIMKKIAADTLLLPLILRGMEIGFFGTDNHSVVIVLLATTLYVYLDFSAYSDMAIGLGRWWGWRMPENFDWPLIRRNMREFWRHWHMSLTKWVTRHVFMQASMEVRRSPRWIQVTLPTFATMLTIGLWHGLEAVWVLWAAHHALGILGGDVIVRRYQVWRAGRTAVLPARLTGAITTGLGIAFVWFWVSLGHCFTTTTLLREAVDNYIYFLTFGLV